MLRLPGFLSGIPLLLCLSAYSQTPASNAAVPQQDGSVPVFKAEARQVVVDVVVTDGHGNAVRGLQKDAFRIQEDGKPQDITFFEEHTGVAPGSAQELPKLPPGVYSNFPTSAITDSVNVLLLDALNTPMKDQPYVRDQMIKYLKQIPQGTRLAIFTLSSRLRFIQGFTTDSSALVAALNSKKGWPQTSMYQPDPDAPDDPLQDMLANGGAATAGALANLQQFQADIQSFQNDMRVRITLEAFQQIGQYLSGIPGRKNLIWFSGSFPLGVGPDDTLQNPFAALRTYNDDVRKTTDLLTIGQVAVYPVDGRGLMTLPMFSAANSGSKYGRNPQAMNQDSAKFFQQTAAEHATMNMLAEETGGEAIYNTNGLKEALARAVNNGTYYYTIAYAPADKKMDGKYRKVKIETKPGGYKLAYRRGYFADNPNGPQPHTVLASNDPMRNTMRRGMPDSTQILFKVRVIPVDPQPDLSDPSKRNGDNGKNIKGPVVRYSVDWAADMHPVATSATPDGLHHSTLEIVAVVYDADGKMLNSVANQLRMNLPATEYAKVLERGLQYHQELDLPKGEVFVRVGIHDPGTDKTGALEIPLVVRPASDKDKKK